MLGSIDDWNLLFKRAFDHLKPGGWLESYEMSAFMESDDGTVTDQTASMCLSARLDGLEIIPQLSSELGLHPLTSSHSGSVGQDICRRRPQVQPLVRGSTKGATEESNGSGWIRRHTGNEHQSRLSL